MAFTPDGTTAFIIDCGPGLGFGAMQFVTTATDTYRPGLGVGKEPAAVEVTRRWTGVTG